MTGFPFKVLCYYCEEQIHVARLSNTKEGMVARTHSHTCGQDNSVKRKLKAIWKIIFGKSPTDDSEYITDREDDPYVE